MTRIHSTLALRKWAELLGGNFTCRKERQPEIRFDKRANMRAIFAAIAAISLISDYAFGQTTRTNRSASSSTKTIPSSSSTSPNSPCNPVTLPTQPALVKIRVIPRPRRTNPVPLRPRLTPELRRRCHSRPPRHRKPLSAPSLKIRQSRKLSRKAIQVFLGYEKTPREYGVAKGGRMDCL